MDTMLPEYLATAMIFIVFAFKVWRRSYSTTVLTIALSIALCMAKHVSIESAGLILIVTTLIMMVRAILQEQDDTWMKGKMHA